VLSNGHASMLLYAMLNLTEVRRLDKNGKVLKELAGSHGGHQALPAVGKLDSRVILSRMSLPELRPRPAR